MTRPLIAAAFALLAVSPAIAASSNQFDLICKGTEQKRTGVPASAWTERFRIDLDAKRWCRGKCTSAASISSVTPDQILIADSRAGIGGPQDVELSLSRTDGKVSETVPMGWSGGGASLAQGSCRREFFSGFPQQRF